MKIFLWFNLMKLIISDNSDFKMANFKKTHIPNYTRAGAATTPDTLYWKKLGFPFTVKEFSAISHIDFSPAEPHYFAVSSSTRVQIYNPVGNQVHKKLSRFHSAAHCSSFRRDGKLLIAGDDEGLVRLFDVGSKSVLRIFKGHTGPVHECKFTTDTSQIVTFSDDKSVGLWDIPCETRLSTYREHKDYIRAGAISLASQDVFLSGSYDHIVKMYDRRSATSVLSVDHGAPVEAILVYPSGGLFISAGGVELKVWDAVAGGRLVAKLTQHHKTATCLTLASGGRRLLSGSLDCHVKIYDVVTYQVVHTLTYPSPILSVGIANDDSTLAVGMADGLLSIQHRGKAVERENISKTNKRKEKGSYKYQLEARGFKPAENDIIVGPKARKRLAIYDKYIRKFERSKALDIVLKNKITLKEPEVTVGVMQELIRRGGILSALGGRNTRQLSPLLHFVCKNIADSRFSRVLVDVANMILDIYTPELVESIRLRKLLKQLHLRIRKEVKFMKELMTVKGTIEILLAAANASKNQPSIIDSDVLRPLPDKMEEDG